MAAARTKMAALNSATSSNAIDPNGKTTVTTLRPARSGEQWLRGIARIAGGRHRPRPARRADSGPYEANGALARGEAGTRNLPTAQAAPLTPIRDERDRDDADEAAMQPAAWRSHISHSQDRYRRFTGRDNCRGRSYVLLAHGLRVSSPRSG